MQGYFRPCAIFVPLHIQTISTRRKIAQNVKKNIKIKIIAQIRIRPMTKRKKWQMLYFPVIEYTVFDLSF